MTRKSANREQVEKAWAAIAAKGDTTHWSAAMKTFQVELARANVEGYKYVSACEDIGGTSEYVGALYEHKRDGTHLILECRRRDVESAKNWDAIQDLIQDPKRVRQYTGVFNLHS